jgi:hypothetical protein
MEWRRVFTQAQRALDGGPGLKKCSTAAEFYSRDRSKLPAATGSTARFGT